MNIFRFEHPDYLYGLFLIPILIFIWIIIIRLQKKKWVDFGELKLVKRLIPNISYRLKNWKFVLIIISIALLIIGLSNPQIGSKLENVKRKGIDMIIAVDISRSMMAEDIKPNRLENSKRSISKLIDQLKGDRIGIIVFAGKAYTQLPITTDYSAAKMFLSTLNTDFISNQGTIIASAIEMGRNTFLEEAKSQKNSKRNKAIIVITDGEDHEEGALKEAQKASEEGINIYTIGMGTAKGAPIPEYRNNKKIGHKKDKDGHTVISRFNESLLQSIAKEGNGTYVRANNSKSGLKNILDEINKLDKAEIETQTFKDYESRFQYLIAFVVLFLIIEIFIVERKNKINSFNWFNPQKKLK